MEENKQIIYKNQSFFVWLVVLFLGFFLARNLLSTIALDEFFFFGILLGYVLTTILYELGKLIFGKIARFNLIKINIFGFCFRKENHKIKCYFEGLTHLGGKTIMSSKSEKSNLVLYSLGGVLFVSIVNLIIYLLLNNSSVIYYSVKHMYLVSICVSLILLVFHLAPVLQEEIYDGFVIRLCLNKEISSKYKIVLKQQEAVMSNHSSLEFIELEDINNPLLAQAILYNSYYLLDHKEYSKLNDYLEKNVNNVYLNEKDKAKLLSLKYYFSLLNNQEDQVGEEFYKLERSIRKKIVSPHCYDTLKTALLISSIIDSSYDTYEYLTSMVDKNRTHYYISRLEIEDELIAKSFDLIETKKKEWFKKIDIEEE